MENSHDDEKLKADVSQKLKFALDSNGFSFQHSVIRRAEELLKNNESLWRLEGTEIPVESGGVVTHIDFVLRHRKSSRFLIAECKRVDPAKGHWCFARTPYTWRSPMKGFTQFDSVNVYRNFDEDKIQSGAQSTLTNTDVMDLGLEVKTSQKGDGVGANERSAINAAVTQVFRSSSGFIQYLFDSEGGKISLEIPKRYYFVPVIFTTAKLFVTNTDIGAADLNTGRLSDELTDIEEKDWIWFNHNRSINLSHSIPFDYEDNKHLELYYRDFTRTVAIVSSKGIDSFLQSDIDYWLYA